MYSLCSLYKRSVYRLVMSPFLWVSGALSVVLSVFGSLFSAGGLFSCFPLISLFLIPAFASILPPASCRLWMPLPDMQAAFAELLALLSAEAFFLLLTLPVPFFLPGRERPEAAAIATGYAGLFLYLAAASALCLFFFSLLTHKGAAFAASSLVLSFFSFAHTVAQHAGLPRFAASFLMALSFSWHEDAASKGIVDSRDLAFYLCCTLFFTAASAAAVQHKRGNDSWDFRRQLALAAAAFVLLVLNSTVFYVRFDLTQGKKFSVGHVSRSLLSDLEAPLTISYYRSAVLRRLYSQVRDIEDFIRVYADAGRRLDYEILDPADRGLEGRLETAGIRPQEIEIEGTAGKSLLKVYSAITIRYKGRTEVIPFLLGMDTLEYDLTSRIQLLVRGMERKVRIIVGNGLSLDNDYPYLAPWLSLQGFSVAEEDQSFLSAGKLAAAAQDECLVLIGSSDLSFSQAQALISYIDGGGKAFIATTPYTVDTLGDWTAQRGSDNLIGLLLKYGICFKDGMTASSSCFQLSLQGEHDASLAEQLAYPLWPVIAPQEEAGKGLLLYWPCALVLDGELAEIEGLQLEGLARTDAGSWQYETDGGEFITNPFTVSKKAPSGAEQGSVPCAVCAVRGGKPAFYVLGDQYALSSRMLAYASASSGAVDTRGLELLSDSLLRLKGQGELLKLKKPARLSSDGQAYSLRTASAVCLIFPLLLLLAVFTVLRMARKRLIQRLQLILGKSS